MKKKTQNPNKTQHATQPQTHNHIQTNNTNNYTDQDATQDKTTQLKKKHACANHATRQNNQ